MAWTAPRTWVAGETVTASILNVHLRDNLNVLVQYGDGSSNKKITFGVSSFTWPGGVATLDATVTHNLGTTPAGVVAVAADGGASPLRDDIYMTSFAYGATTLKLRSRASTTVPASQTTFAAWTAFA